MKFILNTVSGSFLRTIGRILAYILIGLLIYMLLQNVEPSKLAYLEVLS